MCEESGEASALLTLQWGRGEVTCAAASGALLAAGGGDGTLRLWRWRRGAGWLEAGEAARAHRYGVTAVRWADSGVLLASAGVDGAARLWTRELSARRVLAAPGATAARSLCWAAALLLVGHDDGDLCMWAPRAGTLLARLRPCDDGALHAVSTLMRHSLLLVAYTTGTLKIFDFNEVRARGTSGRDPPAPLLWEDGAHDLGALCAAHSAEADAVATGGHDARIRLWHAQGRRAYAGGTLCGHTAAVTALSWGAGAAGGTAGEAPLASASLDRTARLWAPRALACLRVLHPHTRYLTCVLLAPDARFLVTGSNDRTLRTWSLHNFSLDENVEPPCPVLSHFGLGDLEGIDPVYDEGPYEETSESARSETGDNLFSEAERIWSCEQVHDGAINAIAAWNDLFVTACSDGAVRVFRWREGGGRAECLRVLRAHCYPATAADLGAGGALLLSAGLDGRARLWDVESGCELASMLGESVGGGEAGGGGVRGARVSPHRPPLLMLATDDGAVAVWSLDRPTTEPLHVYEPFAEAATCCAWTWDGRVCAAGSAGSELRVLAAPPAAGALCVLPAAHDLGVMSCDFTYNEKENDSKYVLATAGRDALVKIWEIRLETDAVGDPCASHRLMCSVEAHGGGVESVRWAAAAAASCFTSCGADGWVRVWRLTPHERAEALAAVPAGGATGVTAASLLKTSLLAVGTLTGELTVWRLSSPVQETAVDLDEDEDKSAEPRQWREAGVIRWLREYVTNVPGFPVSEEQCTAVRLRALAAGLTGLRLLDEPVDDLLQLLLPDEDIFVSNLEKAATVDTDSEFYKKQQLCTRMKEELLWLRREPPDPELSAHAPHELLCPLTHALLREPARAADGFSYERANILDYFFVVGGAVSPMSGRRLHSASAPPNLRLRNRLRDFLATSSCPR